MIDWIITFCLLYLIVSISYFLFSIDSKNSYVDKWYDYILLAPVIVIAFGLGLVGKWRMKK